MKSAADLDVDYQCLFWFCNVCFGLAACKLGEVQEERKKQRGLGQLPFAKIKQIRHLLKNRAEL